MKVVRSVDGRITAAWTDFDSDRFIVRTATLGATRFRTGTTVSDPAVDSVLADLDAGPSSELAVAWRTGVAGADAGTGVPGLDVAFRRPGGTAFAAAEVVEQGTRGERRDAALRPVVGRRRDRVERPAVDADGDPAGARPAVRADRRG